MSFAEFICWLNQHPGKALEYEKMNPDQRKAFLVALDVCPQDINRLLHPETGLTKSDVRKEVLKFVIF
jgi:plasmid maintenance system antidote protein VapI